MKSRSVLTFVTKFFHALSGGVIGGKPMKRHAGGLSYSNRKRVIFRRYIAVASLGATLGVWGLEIVEPLRVWADETKQTAVLPASGTQPSTKEGSLWNPLTWDWVPSDEEILKYRKNWNPMTHGPILITGVDIQPKGQFLFQPFVFGEIGHQQFDNKLTTHRSDASTHLRAAAPTGIFAYGITNHAELNVTFSGIYWDSTRSTSSGERVTDSVTGIGDTTIYLKYRPVVQNPDTWRPSITIYNGLALPSSQWFGTRGIPGGFSPLGRLPATRFGALSYTEGVMIRKNLQPFRFSSGVFYTYTNPGSTAGMNTYVGDIVNGRFIAEYIHNDQRGLGFNLEFVTLHGLPHRLDGHDLNVKPTSFNLIGVEPVIQYKFFHDDRGALVGAVGCLFTIAGQNNIDAIYPNISLYYYWSKGNVMMR